MNWANLKKNRCPKCNKDWAFDLKELIVETIGGGKHKLLVHGCGFKISEKRYKEIVNGMVNQEIKEND